MTEVRETKLPGVGVRHEFTSEDGNDMAVIVHHDGRRELLSYRADDPDACHSLVSLSEPDTQKDIDLLASFGLVERVPASRHLRTGGYRVTCASIVVLIDPTDASYQPLVSSVLEHVSERSVEVIRRQNRSICAGVNRI